MESSRNKILKSNNFYFTVIVLTSKNKTEGQLPYDHGHDGPKQINGQRENGKTKNII
jgi:hypothetical protein